MGTTAPPTCSFVGTILLDVPVPLKLTAWTSIPSWTPIIQGALPTIFGELMPMFSGTFPPGGEGNPLAGGILLLSPKGLKGCSIMVRSYPVRSALTITIEGDTRSLPGTSGQNDPEFVFSLNFISSLKSALVETFCIGLEASQLAKGVTRPMPVLKRCLPHSTYFTTSDDRLLEYDIEAMLFDEKSQFQHVQIGSTLNYGAVLILDGLVNLAEADVAYTHALMGKGRVDYGGKEVLILGGGDGGLLNELCKENPPPKKVTMIEIDEMVMKACRKYMRGACGSVLDNYKTDQYEIIVGDCLPFMRQAVEENHRFDYIFGDLTDIPIDSSSEGLKLLDFFGSVMLLSFSILKRDGVFFTHGNGASSPSALKAFEDVLKDTLKGKGYKEEIEIQRTSAFIPSFMEKWVFFQVKRGQVPPTDL